MSKGDLEAQAEPACLATQSSPNESRPKPQGNVSTSDEACSEDENFQDAPLSSNNLNLVSSKDSRQHGHGQDDIGIHSNENNRSSDMRGRAPSRGTPNESDHVDGLRSMAEGEVSEQPSDAFNGALSSDNEIRKRILERKIDLLSQLTELRRHEAGLRATAIDDEQAADRPQRDPRPPSATDVHDFAPGLPKVPSELIRLPGPKRY